MTATDQDARSYPFGPLDGLEPHPLVRELRRGPGLTRVTMPYGGEAWLVTRYADAKAVYADPRFSRAAAVDRDVPRSSPIPNPGGTLFGMDPPDHSRVRKIVAKAFTTRRVEQLRPRMTMLVDELLDRMIDSGQPSDLAESLAWPLPSIAMCELLGVPVADQKSFRTWTELTMALGKQNTPEVIADALEQLQSYLAGLIAQRRAEPTDDLLTALVTARDEQDKLSEKELVMVSVSLLIAGHESTVNQLGNTIYSLLTRPQYWRQLVDDPELVPQAVEELLRHTLLHASADLPRIATEDVEVGGQLIRAGETVVVELDSANRDDATFDHPDEIDFHRENNPHIAFGHGIHHCLGAPFVRLELQVALSTLVRRLPGLCLAVPADEVLWRSDRLTHSLQALPVRW